jgi:hypothetical protein
VSVSWIRGGAILFFLLFVAGVTWPGMILGNRIFPLILGLPFSMVWIASWVALSFFVLVILDRTEGKGPDPRAPEESGSGGSGAERAAMDGEG